MLVLVTGVSGSGKSEYAEQLCCQLAGKGKKYYVAAMKPYGKEGRERIARHHKLREGKGFITIEQYQQVSCAAKKIRTGSLKVNNNGEGTVTVLLECLSNLLANECFEAGGRPEEVYDECMRLYSECDNMVIVTNEVFSDGCEYDELTKDYIRRLGGLNIRLAKAADRVIEVVYSISVVLKKEENYDIY